MLGILKNIRIRIFHDQILFLCIVICWNNVLGNISRIWVQMEKLICDALRDLVLFVQFK